MYFVLVLAQGNTGPLLPEGATPIDPQTAESFFTLTSLLSLQGATLAAWLVPAVINNIAGGRLPAVASRLLTTVIALILAYFVAFQSTDQTAGTYILAFFNALLIYAAAVGLKTTVNPPTAEARGGAGVP